MGRVDLGAVDSGQPQPQPTKPKPKPKLNGMVEKKPKPKKVFPVVGIADLEDDTEYHDQEDEFGTSVGQDSDLRHVMKDMDSREGIEGKTDLSADGATLILSSRMFAHDYPAMGFDRFSEWFSIIQLSVGRLSRKERVEILKGNVTLAPQGDKASPPNRGF